METILLSFHPVNEIHSDSSSEDEIQPLNLNVQVSSAERTLHDIVPLDVATGSSANILNLRSHAEESSLNFQPIDAGSSSTVKTIDAGSLSIVPPIEAGFSFPNIQARDARPLTPSIIRIDAEPLSPSIVRNDTALPLTPTIVRNYTAVPLTPSIVRIDDPGTSSSILQSTSNLLKLLTSIGLCAQI